MWPELAKHQLFEIVNSTSISELVEAVSLKNNIKERKIVLC